MQDMKVDLMDIVSKRTLLNLNFLAPFYGWSLTLPRLGFLRVVFSGLEGQFDPHFTFPEHLI